MSTAKILLCHQDAYVDAQEGHIRRSSLCLQPRPYIYSSAPFGEFDTVARPFGEFDIVARLLGIRFQRFCSLSLCRTLAALTPVVFFSSPVVFSYRNHRIVVAT